MTENLDERVFAIVGNGADCDAIMAIINERLRDALAENAELRPLADAARLLGPARRLLDEVADQDDTFDAELDRRCGEMAQRIVDLIGHPVTDEPPHALVRLNAAEAKLAALHREYRVEYPYGGGYGGGYDGGDTKLWQAQFHAGAGRRVEQRLASDWEPFDAEAVTDHVE